MDIIFNGANASHFRDMTLVAVRGVLTLFLYAKKAFPPHIFPRGVTCLLFFLPSPWRSLYKRHYCTYCHASNLLFYICDNGKSTEYNAVRAKEVVNNFLLQCEAHQISDETNEFCERGSFRSFTNKHNFEAAIPSKRPRCWSQWTCHADQAWRCGSRWPFTRPRRLSQSGVGLVH